MDALSLQTSHLWNDSSIDPVNGSKADDTTTCLLTSAFINNAGTHHVCSEERLSCMQPALITIYLNIYTFIAPPGFVRGIEGKRERDLPLHCHAQSPPPPPTC